MISWTVFLLLLMNNNYNGHSFFSKQNARFSLCKNSLFGNTLTTTTRRHCNEASGFDVFYDDDEEEGEQLEVGFCAQAGLESIVISAGNRRVFLSSEYQAVFRLFPKLLDLHTNYSSGNDASVSSLWPLRKRSDSSKFRDLVPSSEEEDRRIILESNTAQKYLQNTISHAEKEILVNNAMEKFRKTILGVEKYRINNPGRLASQYCGLLRSCLDANASDDLSSEWWGAAANSLQYAGLSFRDHVNHTTSNDSAIKATIYLDSLWLQALSRLLDLGAEKGTTNSNTWDQKFFSQIQCSGTDEENIQDMMLGVMRVALCAVFSSFESAIASRDANVKVRIAYRKNSVTSFSSAGISDCDGGGVSLFFLNCPGAVLMCYCMYVVPSSLLPDQQLLMRFQPKEFSVMLVLSAFYRLVPASSDSASDSDSDSEGDVDIFSLAAQQNDLEEEEEAEYEYFLVSPKAIGR